VVQLLTPQHLAATAGELHREAVKISENGAKGAQPRDAEDHVVVGQRDGEAIHGEGLLADLYGHLPGDTAAGHAVAVSNHHVGTGTVQEANTSAVCSQLVDEIVCRAGVSAVNSWPAQTTRSCIVS